MEKILEVKNLKISFRTSSGTLKAVRDISFDLEKGKTLAIVGESGSGKSVTSKAVLGILAGNSIVEGGEILYDGKDLLKISEEEMCKIRGDEVSMIFQDPLSSLNPIVKIGKQITEAMLLKNKTSRKEAKAEFNAMLKLMEKEMTEAGGDAARAKALCEKFDKFCIEANRLENRYNNSLTVTEDTEAAVRDFLFRASKKAKLDGKGSLRDFAARLKKIDDPYLTFRFASDLNAISQELNSVAGDYVKGMEEKDGLAQSIITALEKLIALFDSMQAQARPDFFRIGLYSLDHPTEKLYERDLDELNQMALEYLDQNFMKEFLDMLAKAVKLSHERSVATMTALIPTLEEAQKYYVGEFQKKDALKYAAELAGQVETAIDRMEISKDSVLYTFRSSLVGAINKYFAVMKSNPKEEARYERQSKKREALIAKGKTVDWKVIPKVVYDLDEMKANISKVVRNVTNRCSLIVENAGNLDASKRSVEIVDFMKDKASKVVYVVTRAMAKEKAIKLMEEVGISEPRMRFYQYPFEFSGGMRQRIVIAIALSADPEVLICDEPTTALDVTIQAQILELINRLKAERNLSVVFITHDLGVVANMADDIAVMYAGKIVEYGTADDIFYDPRHPYTWALLSSMPDLYTKEKLDAIPGTPPNMIYPPVGDAFAARNKYAMQIDFEEQPPMFEISETHKAATWLLHPDAPKVELPKIITDRIARMKQKAGGESNG